MLFEISMYAVLGLIVGSFLNVFILRLHTGRSTLGRSGCMSCRTQLTWTELVPVLSFVLLRGRCKSCGSRISHQYWVVEATTALLFALVAVQDFPFMYMLFALLVVSMLVVIGVYDLQHTIIPNEVVYAFLVVSFFASAFGVLQDPFREQGIFIVLVLLSGLVTALPLFVLWLVSRGRWMGFGDVKLVVGFGFLLGLYGGLMAVMAGFIIGAVIGSLILYAPKVIKRLSLSPARTRFTMKSEIPFAPFLIAGFFLVFFFDFDLLALTALFI